MREETRSRIRDKAVSIWLKADADVIMRRVKRRADRPLLQTDDPAATVSRLLEAREPVYQQRRSDDLVARRAARPDRRRMHRRACTPGCAATRVASGRTATTDGMSATP